MTDREALRAAARMVWAHLVTSGPAPWERTPDTVEPAGDVWLGRIKETLENAGFFYGHGGKQYGTADAPPAAAGAEPEMDSPDFRPTQLGEFEARGFERRNR